MLRDLLTSVESGNENLSTIQSTHEEITWPVKQINWWAYWVTVREQQPFEFVAPRFASHLKEWFAFIKENKNVQVKRESNYKN